MLQLRPLERFHLFIEAVTFGRRDSMIQASVGKCRCFFSFLGFYGSASGVRTKRLKYEIWKVLILRTTLLHSMSSQSASKRRATRCRASYPYFGFFSPFSSGMSATQAVTSSSITAIFRCFAMTSTSLNLLWKVEELASPLKFFLSNGSVLPNTDDELALTRPRD